MFYFTIYKRHAPAKNITFALREALIIIDESKEAGEWPYYETVRSEKS
jgi:hypothetical protein